MTTRFLRTTVLPLLIAVVAGCSGPTEPGPTDTGARDAVRAYADAVVRRDWPAAHARLAPEARTAWPPAEFARRGDAYRQKFGFDPTAVHVRTCEERGDDATARIDFAGTAAGRHHFKETLTLRRTGGTWGVVLPARFGQR